jgi:hypothetical protein
MTVTQDLRLTNRYARPARKLGEFMAALYIYVVIYRGDRGTRRNTRRVYYIHSIHTPAARVHVRTCTCIHLQFPSVV